MTRSPEASAVVDAPSEVSASGLPVPKAELKAFPKVRVVVSPALMPDCTFNVGVLPLRSDLPL